MSFAASCRSLLRLGFGCVSGRAVLLHVGGDAVGFITRSFELAARGLMARQYRLQVCRQCGSGGVLLHGRSSLSGLTGRDAGGHPLPDLGIDPGDAVGGQPHGLRKFAA
ncbi:hypothetical protein [Ralstonia pseudosolanacearum]|uniref:hypothetical protein n=1 Tax=Ralstonia pseudosolanacearum TaxID=1310165 RepID=UPI002E1BFE9B